MAEPLLNPLEKQRAATLSRLLHETTAQFFGGNLDARIVAVAHAGACGAVLYGLPDTIKRELVEEYISTLRAFADVPDWTKR